MTLDPNNLIDGGEYANNLLGVPITLQYDKQSGGYKIVTNPERNASEIDAFGRLRVGSPETLFEGHFPYDNDAIHWFGDMSGGTGTYLSDQGALLLTADAGQSAAIQSKRFTQYQPGKSLLVQFTGVYPTKVGSTGRAGYFNTNDGLFFQVVDGALSFVLRTSTSGAPVDTAYAQADWNIDSFDGSGPSGITINPAYPQNAFIDLQWLGVGRVRFGFEINGEKLLAHEIDFANRAGVAPYMRTANLPVRYELIGAAGMAGSAELTCVCSTVISEGGFVEIQGIRQHARKLTATTVGTGAVVPIMSIRPRVNVNGVVNHLRFLLKNLIVLNTGNNPAHYGVIYGGTLTSPSWGNVNALYSGAEVDYAATAIAGGILIEGQFVAAGAGHADQGGQLALSEDYSVALAPDGTHPTAPLTDIYSLVGIGIGGSTTLMGGMTWTELK